MCLVLVDGLRTTDLAEINTPRTHPIFLHLNHVETNVLAPPVDPGVFRPLAELCAPR
jgi:hypothetical protein